MIFIPVFLSIACGYAVMVLVQLGGMYLVTRLGSRHLMVGNFLSGTYFFLLALVWFAGALVSGFVTGYLAPFPPYGTHVFCAFMCFLAGSVVFRNDRELPTHQPPSMTLMLLGVIAAGYFAGDILTTIS